MATKASNICDLPEHALENIFKYLTFDEIAKNRIICRKFNQLGSNMLNHGFYTLLNIHSRHLKKIKSQLPRRESERRSHPLSKYSDILSCIETRLSMLSMTYQKYISNGSACFIPGKVIDECYRILISISKPSPMETKNLRAHEVLQELRDISSMAIEHFDEKIVPEIKKNRPEASQISFYDMIGMASPRCTGFEGFHAFNLSRTQSDTSLTTSSPIKEEKVVVSRTKSKFSSVINLYKKQSKIIKSQSRQISKMFSNLKSLKRRLDDTEIKNRELTESIKQLKEVGKLEIDNVEPAPKKKRSATMVIKRHLT